MPTAPRGRTPGRPARRAPRGSCAGWRTSSCHVPCLLSLRGRTIFGARETKATRFVVHGGRPPPVPAADVPPPPRLGVPGRGGGGSRAVPHLPRPPPPRPRR